MATNPSPLTKRTVDSAKPGPVDRFLWDGALAGFGLKVTPAGRKTFVYQYRHGGTSRRATLGAFGALTVDQARTAAMAMAGKLALGIDPLAERVAKASAVAVERKRRRDTVGALAESFLALYARPSLRSATEYERILRRYVLPEWQTRPVAAIRRRDVVELLDRIAKRNGPVQADATLAVVRKAFNWHQSRDDDFVTPIVRGMARHAARKRDRILTDDEIRSIWTATGDAHPFHQLVRTLLLTAQRRDEVSGMRWREVAGDVWTIPAERFKGKRVNVVPLTAPVRAILDALPRIAVEGVADADTFAFTTTGAAPFSGFSKAKRALDEASGVTGWTLHDLRRTARTLMTRIGISGNIAERVVGHVIPGVAGVYDRHGYIAEKRHALDALAAEIDRIVNQPAAAIIPLRRAARGA